MNWIEGGGEQRVVAGKGQQREGAGRRIRTDDLLITNQLLYQLSYAGILRAETPPSAAISVLTLYAIFYGMPVSTIEHGA